MLFMDYLYPPNPAIIRKWNTNNHKERQACFHLNIAVSCRFLLKGKRTWFILRLNPITEANIPEWQGIFVDLVPFEWTQQPAPWTWADCLHQSSSLEKKDRNRFSLGSYKCEGQDTGIYIIELWALNIQVFVSMPAFEFDLILYPWSLQQVARSRLQPHPHPRLFTLLNFLPLCELHHKSRRNGAYRGEHVGDDQAERFCILHTLVSKVLPTQTMSNMYAMFYSLLFALKYSQ